MDIHAKQETNAGRKDHDEELKRRNERDAASDLRPLLRTPEPRVTLVRGDITQFAGDAIVNAAQETLTGGGGLDQAVHAAAGPALLAECTALPFVPGSILVRCPTGEARITKGHGLRCKHVIHTVGPIGEDAAALTQCYKSVLHLAEKHKIATLAIPCISTGFYGFPMRNAATIAIKTVVDHLRTTAASSLQRVQFMVYNDVEYVIYKKLLARPAPAKKWRPTLVADEQPCVMVIDQNASNNWYAAFRGKKAFNGQAVRVEQTAWQNVLHSWVSATAGVTFDLEPTPECPYGTSQSTHRSVSPHVVVVRNFARGAKDNQYLNHLFVLQHGGVPCVNGIEALIAFFHRANAIAQMQRVEQMIGDTAVFQGVPIDMYSNVRELYFKPSFPLVAKVGSCHAGTGKMRFMGASGFDDFHGLVSMASEYVTLEPFLDRDYEYRLQRMGDKVRCYSRASLSHDWKANQGEGEVSDMVVTERHEAIVRAVDSLFPHMDIWGVDLLVTRAGDEYALEINDSAIGFNENHIKEDMGAIVQRTLQRLCAEYAKVPCV